MVHKRTDLGLVTGPLRAGVERLVAVPLSLNGEAPTPAVQLVGADADGSAGTWQDRLNGEVLAEAGSGSSPDYGEPGPGLLDLGVRGKGSGNKRIEADDNSYGQISTEDFVVEIVMSRHDAVDGHVVCGNWAWPGAGLSVWNTNGTRLDARIEDGGGTAVDILSAVGSATSDTALHALLAADRSGSAQWYVNGAASGGATDISSVGDLTRALPFTVFARSGGGVGESTHCVHLIQVWRFSDIGTHVITDTARERAAAALGHRALHSHTSLTPSSL